MGMTRKFLSMSTVGLVDFRSDKERAAAYGHGVLRQQKAQTKLLRNQAGQQPQVVYVQGPAAAPAPVGPPPGWYPDQQDQQLVRWFDGSAWTAFTQPRQ